MANNDDAKKRRLTEEERAERLTELVLRRSKLEPEEVELLRQVFSALVEAHFDDVWERFRRRGLALAEAEDLTQDVFTTLYRHLVAEGFPESMGAWLSKVAENKLLNHLRDARRNPISLGMPSSGSEPPRTPPQPERTMDRRNAVLSAIPQLSKNHQAVVTIVILHGLTTASAAEVLGIAEGTVKSRLMAAKRHLATLLGPLLPPSERGTTA